MLTQHQKIITKMCLHEKTQPFTWWYPPDFMQSGDLFVGYEASARLSELAKLYPNMIESRREGKYFYRRIRLEAIDEWYADLPEELKLIVKMYYRAPHNPKQRSLL